MNIYVDADACPVKEKIKTVAMEFNIPVFMFIDTSHILHDSYSTVITVDKSTDSVDFAIINRICPGDILVTQDYGLASMALARLAHVIHQNGFLYTQENIDRMLFERHISKKIRLSGGRAHHTKKRTTQDNIKFEGSFRKLCQSLIREPD